MKIAFIPPIIAVLVLLLPVLAHAETRVAFVLGNSTYDHAPELPNPSNDADLIAGTLESLDFAVTRHSDLTVRETGRALSNFLTATRGADVTLFYFAGHGMQFEGKNYLLGRDSRIDSVFDVKASALELDTIIAELESSSRAALVFVDACRNNPIAERFYRSLSSASRSVATRGLAPIDTAYEGAMITFSASPGQEALDGEAGGTSPFATALAKHLPTANMEVLSLMKRVIRDVRDGTGGLQTPMVTNDLAAEVYLQTAATDMSSLAAKALREARAISDAGARSEALMQVTVDYPGTVGAEFAAMLLRTPPPDAGVPAAATPKTPQRPEKAAIPDLPGPAAVPEAAERALALDREDYRRVQTLLRDAGHDAGPPDGVFGTRSRMALRAFQAAMAEADHGYVTPRTLALLETWVARDRRTWDGLWELVYFRRNIAGNANDGMIGVIAVAEFRITDGKVKLQRFSDSTMAPDPPEPRFSATLLTNGRLDIAATVNYEPFRNRARTVSASFRLPVTFAEGDQFKVQGSRLSVTHRMEATLTRMADR